MNDSDRLKDILEAERFQLTHSTFTKFIRVARGIFMPKDTSLTLYQRGEGVSGLSREALASLHQDSMEHYSQPYQLTTRGFKVIGDTRDERRFLRVRFYTSQGPSEDFFGINNDRPLRFAYDSRKALYTLDLSSKFENFFFRN